MKPPVSRLFLVTVVLLVSCLRSQVLLELSNDTLQAYDYSDGDEFNTEPAKGERWNMRIWPGTNVTQFFAYEPSNTRIKDGVAVFSVTRNDSDYVLNRWQIDSAFFVRTGRDPADRRYHMRYAAGSIVSGKKYHYGLYELRFKIEEGKGTWPAFWFYGGDRNEEIDVFELKGEKTDKIHVDTHCPAGCDPLSKNFLGVKKQWGRWLPVSQHLYEGFNVMMLDWQPGVVTWYINGYPLATFYGQFANPMNLYINTQVASEYSAFQPGPDETTKLPNNFYVDYLRIWNKSQATSVLRPAKGFEASKLFASTYRNKPTRRHGVEYNKKTFGEKAGMVSVVLLENNRLQVCILGEFNEQPAEIVFRGAYGIYYVRERAAETILEIDARESNLEFSITTRGHSYTHALEIKR
jgi:beta-glucanase (GH16 family)